MVLGIEEGRKETLEIPTYTFEFEYLYLLLVFVSGICLDPEQQYYSWMPEFELGNLQGIDLCCSIAIRLS